MRLADHQVTTDEVKSWQGLHLLHFQGSSCSQKVRTFLGAKGIDYVPHHVDILRDENATPWFVGINPRGVVPVLVHDGVVHIESNDIMAYADTLPSPAPSFFPSNADERRLVEASLHLEGSLHHDLRNITMEFLLPNRLVAKSSATLAAYQKSGPPDPTRSAQIDWWRSFAANGGVSKHAVRESLQAFRDAFNTLEQRLTDHAWLIGNRMSVLEVAWFISVHRLSMAGYPLEDHPNLANHYRKLLAEEAFGREVETAPHARLVMGAYGAYRRLRGTALRDFQSARA
ncbi:MAG: glutathione S-transferase family protein [Myxococcota bacterium]